MALTVIPSMLIPLNEDQGAELLMTQADDGGVFLRVSDARANVFVDVYLSDERLNELMASLAEIWATRPRPDSESAVGETKPS